MYVLCVHVKILWFMQPYGMWRYDLEVEDRERWSKSGDGDGDCTRCVLGKGGESCVILTSTVIILI